MTAAFGFLIIVDLMFMDTGNAFVYDPDYKVRLDFIARYPYFSF